MGYSFSTLLSPLPNETHIKKGVLYVNLIC